MIRAVLAGISRTPLIPFFLVGICSSLVDIGGMYLLISLLGMWYLPASVCSYSCGIVFSYFSNRNLTFHDSGRATSAQFAVFAAVSLSCLIVNTGIVWISVSVLSLVPLTGKIVATCAAFFWNYHGQRRFTFGKTKLVRK